MLVNNISIQPDPYREHYNFTWLSRHIWIRLHLLWSSYLEATGSYLRNCPDFEKKMTDPGQWSRVRCLETTRTASQAAAPPAGMPLLHLIIKNGKKKLYTVVKQVSTMKVMKHQMLTLNLLDKKREKKLLRFQSPMVKCFF